MKIMTGHINEKRDCGNRSTSVINTVGYYNTEKKEKKMPT